MVVIGNWTEELPFGTVTFEGTVTLVLFEATVTYVFPLAAVRKVIVPTEDFPPRTLFGETANPDRIAGKTCSCALDETDPSFAVMLAT